MGEGVGLAGPDLQRLETLAADAPLDETPAASSPSKNAVIEDYSQTIRQLAGPAFDVLAPGWKVKESEVGALADAWAGVLYKYYPDGIDDAHWLVAAVTTAAVFAPRIVGGVPRVVEEPQPKASGAANDG